MIRDEHKRSRHSYQLFVVLFCIYTGGIQVITSSTPSNLQKAVDPFYQKLWSICVLISAVFVLFGTIRRNPVVGSMIELSGQIGLGFANLVYGLSVLFVTEAPAATYAGPLTVGISAAAFWRVGRLSLALFRDHALPEQDRLIEHVAAQLADSAQDEAKRIIEQSKESGGE